MSTEQVPRSDEDSPWKEAIERYFESFMALLFPEVHAGIDWERGFEFLDTELQQVVRDAETGRRRVDKLVRVWRKDGDEAWVLLHVEVQGDPEISFPKRMFRYNYRIYDRYDRPVVSLAVLADDRESWRPDAFEVNAWGFRLCMQFPTVKLIDWRDRWEELTESNNPFAIVVRAHLKAQETRADPEQRLQWKWTLIRELYDRGYDREEVLELFRFIDWLMALPPAMDEQLIGRVTAYEEERRMPYVTSAERVGLARGLEIGRSEGLEQGLEQGLQQGALAEARQSVIDALDARFGAIPTELRQRISAADDLALLRELRRHAVVVESCEQLSRWLADR